MDQNYFLHLYKDYSEAELVKILTTDKSKYKDIAIDASRITLEGRSINVNNILEEYDIAQNKAQLAPEDQEVSFIDQMDAEDQMDYLTQAALEMKIHEGTAIQSSNKELTDTELIHQFSSIIRSVIDHDAFGTAGTPFSKKQFLNTFAHIYDRKLQIEGVLKSNTTTVLKMIQQKLSSKRNLSIGIGIVLIIAGVGITAATEGARFFYGAIVVGLGMIVKATVSYSASKSAIEKLKHYLKN